jgi:SMC interacting uncharacterized protein involved in chromosome segregation
MTAGRLTVNCSAARCEFPVARGRCRCAPQHGTCCAFCVYEPHTHIHHNHTSALFCRSSSIFAKPAASVATSKYGNSHVHSHGHMDTRADPRPVTSKAYVTDSIQELLEFLTDSDFQQRISPKLLSSPTGKDFTNIVTFLFRMFDPTYIMAGKMEDEVQLVFKALR